MQPLVESAVSLLTSAKLERLRRCGNSTCYWLFIDETRNHSRRWCEMASCGNVVKVRRHREKARSAAHENQDARLKRITHKRARAAAPSAPCTVLKIWIAF